MINFLYFINWLAFLRTRDGSLYGAELTEILYRIPVILST
jgi:hypothetical protein